MQPDGFAELRNHFFAIRTFAAHEKGEHVLSLGTGCIFSQGIAQGADGMVPIRRRGQWSGNVEPSLELTKRVIEITATQKDNAEIHVGRRQLRQ